MSTRDNEPIASQWGQPADQPAPTVSFDKTFINKSAFGTADTVQPPQGRVQIRLSEELLRKNYHPVMIFGTRASGKSSLLASLFYYLQTDLGSPAIPVLGEWIVPIDTPYGQSVAEAASQFFTHVLSNFHDGEAAPSTRNEYPFYIPIILRPNNGQPEIRLAFLESRGEWYHIDKNSKDLFPQLREEVADVYQNFTKGISILLIAPYVIGDAYPQDELSEDWKKNEMRISDSSLFGALQSYQTHRQNRELDKYLFILTKWDAHTRSLIDRDFSNPPHGMVSYFISERYPRSWTLFQTMQSGAAQSMQYSAGVMSGNARADTPMHLLPIMNQFPKMLWSWLYSNATNGQDLFLNSRSKKHGPEKNQQGSKLARILRRLQEVLL